MSPRHKPSVALSQVPSVRELCHKLGFEGASARDTSGFTDSTRAWRKGYKTQAGQPGAELTDWNSPIVQQELFIMATKFLEGGNGERYWSTTMQDRQNTEIMYPRDKDMIIEVMIQLFWKQNKYVLNNQTYAEKRGNESRDQTRDKTTPSQDAPSTQQKPGLFARNNPETEYHGPYGSPPNPQIQTDGHRAPPVNARLSNGFVDSEPTARRTETPTNIEDIDFEIFNIPDDSLESTANKGPAPTKHVTLKVQSETLSRFNNRDVADETLQPKSKKPRTNSPKKLKTRRTSSLGGPLRASGRKRTAVYSDLWFSEESSSDGDKIYYNRHGTRRTDKNPQNTAGPQENEPANADIQSLQQNLTANMDEAAENRPVVGQSAINGSDMSAAQNNAPVGSGTQNRDGFHVPSAPVTSEAASVSETPTRDPELLTIPDEPVSSTMSPEPAPKSKPKIRGMFWVISSSEPNYVERQWADGTIQGKGLQFVVQEVSKISQRSNVEKLKLKLETPFAKFHGEVQVNAEDDWEILKRKFTKEIKEGWSRNRGQPFQYDIYIEPIEAARASPGATRGDEEDFDFSL